MERMLAEVGMIILLTLLQMYRLTIRATDESVPQVLMEAMEKRLALGEAPFYPP